ncbi:anhydro-N-acetylmuramic acid kinase [Burkholderia gladioli]|uniref:anhydro-N-acetylmuramic acid kinase n=2 Tax=Burkholderia gladioli TaxID=28095 RepID=UPI000D00A6D0|nr:anhydro-N-acetylmuramic acid kinase [Burkholderia gladioli]MBJ9659479.1 anhydro-N-acetylmuramic acid kinase [Burkholderia gladioli]MDN7497554.1 anhydro-N-acetylmuramic acid kinase [Burkholderia gladioli]PRE87238.1 anhydro-N-acetylmuramic acid kinase [Burkholderia gladioli]
MAPNPAKRTQPGHPADGVYFGLMSGTSMDGCDGIAVRFSAGEPPAVLAEAFVGFADSLREALFALQQPGSDEIERESLAANALAARYAVCCHELQRAANLGPADVHAIGVHGQTVRHRPERGYTRQTNNPALLAELTHIDVIADFRSRDIAAGGQGAPLAPAFHATLFGSPEQTRVVCNLGGISNITLLPAEGAHGGAGVRGFDCGPANALLDAWALRHLGKPYDEGGRFAARGRTDTALLAALLAEPYFDLPPPKSTGRDLFNPDWLETRLQAFAQVAPEDVQATLTTLTAVTVAREIARHAPDCRAVYVCGGGARNPVLMSALGDALAAAGLSASLDTTAALGVPPQQVEAIAFAWLAYRFTARLAGNIPGVTGAAGERVLGALYPR